MKKKTTKKVKASKASSQELRITIAPQQVLPTEQDMLEPLTAGGNKMALTPTWIKSAQLIQLMGKTPTKFIYTRPGKGGQKFTYVTGSYIIKALNFVFGWNWDFEVVAHGKEGDQVWVQGKLTVKSPKGDTIVKTQFGRADIKFKKDSKVMLDFGNDLKGATTDAMKKCASLLGIASDVYGKEEFKNETGKDIPPTPPAPNANTITVDATDSQEVPDPEKVIGPDGKPTYLCQNCADPIADVVAGFSQKMFKKRLCRDCQPKRK